MKTTTQMNRAYEGPEVDVIFVETSPTLVEGTVDPGPGGGGMDDPSPEVPD